MRNSGLRRVLLLSVILCCSAFLALSARAAEQAARRPMVALTFDDGPYSPVTGRILDVLECSDSRATFFVEGDRVSGCAPTVRRAAELGCQIGVHTWDHRCLMTQLSEEEIRAQLSATADAVSQASGIVPTLSRPVGGAVNDTVRKAIDYPMILWSVDTRDWEPGCGRGLRRGAQFGTGWRYYPDARSLSLHGRGCGAPCARIDRTGL